MIYTVNLMLVAVIRFLSRKFCYIGRQAEAMSKSNKKLNNRKLSKLLYDYNHVHTELEVMNRFFQKHVGYNLVHFFILGVLTTFSCLFSDIRMAVGVMMIILVMYICVIYIPFQQANRVPIEVMQD